MKYRDRVNTFGKVCEDNRCSQSLGIDDCCLCLNCFGCIVWEPFGIMEHGGTNHPLGIASPNNANGQASWSSSSGGSKVYESRQRCRVQA